MGRGWKVPDLKWGRERMGERERREGERERDTESEAGSRLRAVSTELDTELEIGRASCRERVCLYV